MLLTLPTVLWTPSPNFSSRNGNKVRLVVIHDCEGSFLGSVSWFAMTASQVSAHYILSEDGTKVTQMVHAANKAWHVCNANGFSEGIEAAGYAAKGLGAPEWEALAALTAYRLRLNDIPCQRATTSNNWTGYCEHWQLGQMGGGHHDITDPVDGAAQRSAFDALVAKFYAYTLPTSWGPDRSVLVSPPLAPVGWVSPHPGPRHDFQEGSLEWIQAKLNALHIPTVPLIVDGMLGYATEKATAAFQALHDLDVDGDPGPDTIKVLESL